MTLGAVANDLGSLVVQHNDVAGGPPAQQDANQLRQTLKAGDEKLDQKQD